MRFVGPQLRKPRHFLVNLIDLLSLVILLLLMGLDDILGFRDGLGVAHSNILERAGWDTDLSAGAYDRYAVVHVVDDLWGRIESRSSGEEIHEVILLREAVD
jgi:hypothetical protein